MRLQFEDVEGNEFPLNQALKENDTGPSDSRPESWHFYVARARHGDEAAFRDLYKSFFPMVHGIVLARVPVAEVEDLIQEVFLQAWRQLSTLRDNRAFGGWLAQITRHRCIDHLRSRERTEPLPVDLKVNAVDEGSWFLLNAIHRLPEAYRETLTMRFAENLTGPEIALLTGLTPESVRVNLHRGAALLRDQLKGGSR